MDPVNGMLSLSEAEKGLSFPLAKPAYLPDGYSFAFAIPYESNGTTFEGVNLIYKSGDKPILQITERTLATFNQFSQKFTDHVTDIEINGNPGKLMITRESRVQVLLRKPSSFIYIMSELPKEEVVRILESAK
ncbi:DUF4367 domain-containing protein [Paenibacillus sp. CC-CFT747]|nr:DUF4367 domain-containing protein [Paenibacillus sp. CC-CFT747]